MGLDYAVINKAYKYTGKSIQDWMLNQSHVFSKVMGLPDIPIIITWENDGYNNPSIDYNMLLQYTHWQEWGVQKLNSITIDDVKGKFNPKFAHCYETENELKERKEDILFFLDCFIKGIYFKSSV